MARNASLYYPPRARWYSPLRSLGARIRRRMALDGLRLPSGQSIPGLIASVLVPGVAFYLSAPRFWGRIAVGLTVLMVLVIVAWFGFPVAGFAGGLLLSIHACGLALLFDQVMLGTRFRTRLLFGLAILVALATLLYLPGRDFVQKHWFVPLRIHDKVVVITRSAPSASLRRGDQVAYSFEQVSAPGLIVRGGFGLGPVLALPGDRVRFTPEAIEVNGVARPRLELMPQGGEWVVPEKHWFVWPEIGISGHGHTASSEISQTLMTLGTISEQEFLGKPAHRWLWRKQF